MTSKEIKTGILETVDELNNLLDDRISELHNLCGAKGSLLQTERHAFCYYRDYIWKIRDLARQIKEK